MYGRGGCKIGCDGVGGDEEFLIREKDVWELVIENMQWEIKKIILLIGDNKHTEASWKIILSINGVGVSRILFKGMSKLGNFLIGLSIMEILVISFIMR